MAMVSVSPDRIGLSAMDQSSLGSASDVVTDSQSLRPASCSSEAPDRNDPSSSSPSPGRETEAQSPAAALRSEEYRQLFRLPPDEVLVQDFNCALQESILLQGHMYLFLNYICFYSNIFGFETKKIIPFHEVTSVKRAKTAAIFPNAIEIFAGGRKYFFASFLFRDEAFKLINDGWLQCDGGAQEMPDQKESMIGSSSQEGSLLAIEKESISGSDDQENGLILIEKVNNFEQVSDRDTNSRLEDTGNSEVSIDDDSASKAVTQRKDNMEQSIEPMGINSSTSSRKPWAWNVHNIDSPEIPNSYTKVAETKFQIKVEEFFNLFFSDDAIHFVESFHKRCNDKEFRCSLWCSDGEFGHTRDVSFQHPIKIYFGAKFGSCQEVQKFRVYRNSHLVVETSQDINDVPYGDYFCVKGLWDVVRDGKDSTEGCILRIYVDVAFSKRTVFKGKIVQSTLEECREAYALWINMVMCSSYIDGCSQIHILFFQFTEHYLSAFQGRELLKQKNIDKQEEKDPIGRLIQNGEVHDEREEVTTDRPSASLGESSDCITRMRMSGSEEATQQGIHLTHVNLMNSTSFTSFVGGYITKFCSVLKSQSQITLILVVAFAVIFLMQVSIVVLLNRPQNVHFASPEQYTVGIGADRIGERSETVAWLERRTHHLRDEMLMVEARLERLRHEYAWLKAQWKDLEHRKHN